MNENGTGLFGPRRRALQPKRSHGCSLGFGADDGAATAAAGCRGAAAEGPEPVASARGG